MGSWLRENAVASKLREQTFFETQLGSLEFISAVDF
jgi:hypothetical protein